MKNLERQYPRKEGGGGGEFAHNSEGTFNKIGTFLQKNYTY